MAIDMTRQGNGLRRVAILSVQAAVVAAFVVIWQVGSDHHWINAFIYSRPSLIWGMLKEWARNGTLVSETWSTLQVLLLGWGLGLLMGTALGMLVGMSETARTYFEPFLIFFNGLPRLLFLPVFVIWFGFGTTPKVILVVFVVVFIVAMTVANGVREVEDDLVLNVRLHGASKLEVLLDAFLPAIALWVVSSSRTTVGFAFQATVAAEFIGSSHGLGALVVNGQQTLDTPQVYAALVVMFVVAIVLDSILGVIQKRVTKWMPQ
jgi:NitT/TauT family transport system permease protein